MAPRCGQKEARTKETVCNKRTFSTFSIPSEGQARTFHLMPQGPGHLVPPPRPHWGDGTQPLPRAAPSIV